MPTKKAKAQEPVTEKGKEDTKPFFEASRKVLLAAIGAAALAQDEIEDFVNRLVERGTIAEKDGHTLVSEMIERRKKLIHKMEGKTGRRIQEAMSRMNIPSRTELDDLSAKISELTKKIEELKAKDT